MKSAASVSPDQGVIKPSLLTNRGIQRGSHEQNVHKMRGKQKIALALLVPIIAGVSLYLFIGRSPYSSAEEALQAFYGGDPRPECMQATPLHWHGATVVPLIMRELPNKAMPRRRYAIHFLGEERHVEALPTLEAILLDNSERFYFRADALLAIYDISPIRAAALARAAAMQTQDLADEFGYLKRVAQDVERGKVELYRRRCD